jgi:hypothetical protein
VKITSQNSTARVANRVLAFVLLFLNLVGPVLHERSHARRDGHGASVAQKHTHGSDAILAGDATGESADSCALCVLQNTQGSLTLAAPRYTFYETLPAPGYDFVPAPSHTTLCVLRRGPPRGPPSLV